MHKGHRERLKTKFEEHGDGALYDHELLETLLFYSIPRVNTNPIAHDLISRFGSLEAVLGAEISELMKVNGVGRSSAILIKLVGALSRPRKKKKIVRGTIIRTYSDATGYILKFYEDETKEKLGIIFLDESCRVIDTKWLCGADSAFTPASVSFIIREAVSLGARSIILCHNHPGGIAIPSSEDINATSSLGQALRYVQIRLLEHFVVADGRWMPIIRPAAREHSESLAVED